MVLNTVTVSTAVAPTVVQTYVTHYLNRKPLRQKPTAHISYHEGVELIRRFLIYASHHTVEELQAFTSQWVPCPTWVKVSEVTIPSSILSSAASHLIVQLGHKGIDQVGGETWWQWRQNGELQAEWIEMKRDHAKRKQTGEKDNRVMLYVHGGAYFFGSVDEHRYQMQRHARKLEARVFAPRYRLAPQYPFPCGLHDCLAAYLYLLTVHSASEIILAGDSAGAGMLVSIMVTLRDQGLPLPAGAILISPWVDLSHSFPSVAGDGRGDYIPAHGFMHRPSAAWPPPTAEDMRAIAQSAIKSAVDESLPRKSTQETRQKLEDDALKDVKSKLGADGAGDDDAGVTHELRVELDGEEVVIKDQIQMYTTNQLISHPLVSPVLQPSLGGLPPLLIMTGGGEILRDEQIYLAHKAANPGKYPPSAAYLENHGGADAVSKWRPTDVQLQVWDDLCHVAPTLSFTRPAKYMYRSIAQFGAWALAKAQKCGIEIQDDDAVSVISSSSSSDLSKPDTTSPEDLNGAANRVGKAGDPLPPFKHHMIRQRIDRNGNAYPLVPTSSLPALQLSPEAIGVPKAGPLRKWLNAKQTWDTKYAREKRHVQKRRAKEMAKGYATFRNDEVPPPSALAGRRGVGEEKMPMEGKGRKERSWGMSLWSMWGSTHDGDAIQREEKADREVATSNVTNEKEGEGDATRPPLVKEPSKSRSRRRTVTYSGEDNPAAAIVGDTTSQQQKSEDTAPSDPHLAVPPAVNPKTKLPEPQQRPSKEGQAFPFKLKLPQLAGGEANASMLTLVSEGVATPAPLHEEQQAGKQLGDAGTAVTAAAPTALQEERRETVQGNDGVLHKAPVAAAKGDDALQTTGNEVSSPAPAQSPETGAEAVDPVPIPDFSMEDRRETIQGQDGVLHKAPVVHSATEETLPPAKASHQTTEAITPAPAHKASQDERRETIQGEDGVLHKGPAATSPAAGADGAPSEPKEEGQSATGVDEGEESDDTMRGDSEGRRGTMVGEDGVLHHAAGQEEKERGKSERPGIERFETAQEEL